MRQFLERYLSFTPGNVSRNWADALNMTTSNLRRSMLKQMTDDNSVGKIQDDQMRSDFNLRGTNLRASLTISALKLSPVRNGSRVP